VLLEKLREYLCGHQLVWLCHRHEFFYGRDVCICTCISREARFGAELGEILVGSLRGVEFCGVVRACALQGRELCLGRCVVDPVNVLVGVCLPDVERGAQVG